jgi:hypothetical protein
MLRFCLLSLLVSTAFAQQVAPRQIQPSSTNGQVLTTVSGATAWANGGGGGGGPAVAIDMTASPCSVPTDHVTDITASFNACLNMYTNSGAGAATYAFFLPRTNTAISSHGSCDYVATGSLIVPKTLYEATIYGQTQGEDLGVRICTTTTNTTGMLVNSYGLTLRNITFYGADGWVPTNSATNVLTGTADGVRVCGPSTHLDHVSALYYSRHGINLASTGCAGGSTDFSSSDDSVVDSPYTKFNQGNGINVNGASDSNLITIIGGNSDENQLFGFQDRSLYPATVINLETSINHFDQNTFTSGGTLTSCSVTNGILTCTCPSACGIATLDEVSLAGTNNSTYNQRYVYTLAHSTGTSATTFYLLTGDVGPADGTSATGGTVSYGPGARIWATNGYLGGCCYGSISGRSTWINMYAEDELGPMVNPNVGMISGQGAAGNQIFFYNGSGSGLANVDAEYFSALGAQIFGSNGISIQGLYQVININPFTNRAMGTVFRPASGVSGGGGVDAGWSIQAGTANLLTMPQEILEVLRSNTGANTDGYWSFSLADNFPTTAADTFFRLYDAAATTHSPGTVEFPNTNPVLFDTTPEIGTAPVPVTTASPTVGQAACIKSTGPPIVLGTCSTVVSSSGACTCN